MKQAILCNIQKFCLHDGPGIRTTVFFKGCPLRCKWCANPESQQSQIQVTFQKEACTHCLACLPYCKQQALTYREGQILIDRTKCIGCTDCCAHCPTGALSSEGYYKTLAEIVEVCLQDLPFYEESNGGVTLSGGEGMLQQAIVQELVEKLKNYQIHTAIETTGYVFQPIFRKLAPLFDLLLFDLKHYDTKKHEQETGVENRIIIDNLQWALHHDLTILIRIPIIPGFNNAMEDAHHFVQLCKELNIHTVELLPFHQFGQKKYDLLQQEYEYQNKKPIRKDELQLYRDVFIKENIKCYL